MVRLLEVKLDNEKGNVTVDAKMLDYNLLYEITIDVIDNGKKLEMNFEGFDEVPDLKVYYEEIFQSINALATDTEITDLKIKAEQASKNEWNIWKFSSLVT